MKNMKKLFCILTLALFGLALLGGCGSSGDKLSDPDAIETYGTMIWDNELIDVCFTHDQEKIYIYYDDGDYALFKTVDLPVEDFHDGDNDWSIYTVELEDVTDNGYSDLRAYIAHSDMSESSIFWTWSEDFERFVYQPTASFFYTSSEDDDSSVLDFSMYEGIWIGEEENMFPNMYIYFDSEGKWQLDSDGELVDEGYLYFLGDDGPYLFSYESGALDGGYVEVEGDRLYISTAGYFTQIADPSEGDFSVYEGVWLGDDEYNQYDDIYMEFDSEGYWYLYIDGEMVDEGYIQYIPEWEGIYAEGVMETDIDGCRVELEGDQLYIGALGYFNHVD